jgi:hypothetical protein
MCHYRHVETIGDLAGDFQRANAAAPSGFLTNSYFNADDHVSVPFNRAQALVSVQQPKISAFADPQVGAEAKNAGI